jgi:hypothetical protein
VPAIIRKLPASRDPQSGLFGHSLPASPATAPAPKSHRPVVAPLSPEKYRIQFTADADTHALLRRARELPGGDPAAVVKRALAVLVDDLERKRHGKTDRPREAKPARAGSPHVPNEVKREVHARDGGQCTFVGPDGRRCTERAFMQYHHDEMPHAFGGKAATEGMSELCGAHNRYLGRQQSGSKAPSRRPAPTELEPDPD